MKIDSINVAGDLCLNFTFSGINILLGENNTGKSTFVKLLLYALGVNINNFIDEIAKENKCNSVSITIETKAGNKYYIIRKLPFSDYVNIFPFSDSGKLITEDVLVYNLVEYSNFLLEEEMYPPEIISYGQGKTASLRYYFLLRAAVVDQTTPHSRIFSSLSGLKNDYIASQPLINSAILEKLLNRNTSEIQRLKLELKTQQKNKNELNSKIQVLKEMIEDQIKEFPTLPKTLPKLREALEKNVQSNDKLTAEQYTVLIKLEQTADKECEDRILALKKSLNEKKVERTNLLLSQTDVKNIAKKLEVEQAGVKKRLASHQIINSIPVTICPICFSHFDGTEMCAHCKDVDIQKSLDNLAAYKKLIDDSMREASALIASNGDDLHKIDISIKGLQNKVQEIETYYLKKLKAIKSPLESIIVELKTKISELTEEAYVLKDLIHKNSVLEQQKMQRKELNETISSLTQELESASKKTINDLEVTSKWNNYFNEIYSYVFDSTDIVSISDEDYLPVINETPIHKVSSESMKLIAQLTYVYTLSTLETQLNVLVLIILDLQFMTPRRIKIWISININVFYLAFKIMGKHKFFLQGVLKT